MSNTRVCEVLFVVLFFVKSYYSLDIKLFKDLNIFLWMMTIPLILVSLFNRSHESHELSRNDPIKVTVLNSLIQLVLFDVESLESIPIELNSVLQALKHLQ
jgi:hypothetical protein